MTARDWTIVQMFYRDRCPVDATHPLGWESRCEKYVVETGLKSLAVPEVEAWLDADLVRRDGLHEVHYYPRSYVAEAKQLRAAGRWIP